MPDCQRCPLHVVTCNVCKGDGKVRYAFGDCTDCNGTGYVCPKHGKHWRR